jgi:hypothetical protein
VKTKIVDASGKTLAELAAVRLAGHVGPMGTDFAASGDDALMTLAMHQGNMQMVHEGNVYNCMVQTSNMVSNAGGTGFAIRGKIWPR